MSNFEVMVAIAEKAEATRRTNQMINLSKTLGCTPEGDLKTSHAIFSGKITKVDAYVESYSENDSIKIECTFTGKNAHTGEAENDRIFTFDAKPPFKGIDTIDVLKTVLEDQFRGEDVSYHNPTKQEAVAAMTHKSGEQDNELLAEYLAKGYKQLMDITVTVASFDRVTKAGANRHYYSMTAKDIIATNKIIQDGGASNKPIVGSCL